MCVAMSLYLLIDRNAVRDAKDAELGCHVEIEDVVSVVVSDPFDPREPSSPVRPRPSSCSVAPKPFPAHLDKH